MDGPNYCANLFANKYLASVWAWHYSQPRKLWGHKILIVGWQLTTCRLQINALHICSHVRAMMCKGWRLFQNLHREGGQGNYVLFQYQTPFHLVQHITFTAFHIWTRMVEFNTHFFWNRGLIGFLRIFRCCSNIGSVCGNKLAFMWELSGYIKQSASLLCLIHSTLWHLPSYSLMGVKFRCFHFGKCLIYSIPCCPPWWHLPLLL